MTFKKFKSAITYKCDLPAAKILREHLLKNQFVELGLIEYSRAGFIDVTGVNDIIFDFPGGIAFKLRYDEKIVPAKVVTAEANKRILALETEQDRRLPKAERSEIREAVYTEFVQVALINTQIITCYYNPKCRLLVVPTTSKKLANIVTSRLIKAIGSIKATTIYVDSYSKGLTPKIKQYICREYVFAKFDVCGLCKLKDDKGHAFSFKVKDLHEAKEGVLEAIESGAEVVEIELSNQDLYFKINNKFMIKGIEYINKLAEPENFNDTFEQLKHETSVQLELFSAMVNDLIDLFEYKEPDYDI